MNVAQLENTDAFLFCDPLPQEYVIAKMGRLFDRLKEAIKRVEEKQSAANAALIHNFSAEVVRRINNELTQRKLQVREIKQEIDEAFLDAAGDIAARRIAREVEMLAA